MKTLNLTVRGRDGSYGLAFSVRRMVNAGYVGRDQEAVRKHIKELKREGIPSPDEVPALFPVASYLITMGGVLEVVEDATSGEAEFVLLVQEGQTYVGAGSDHTDRRLEKTASSNPNRFAPM
jgi:hypothetical protein